MSQATIIFNSTNQKSDNRFEYILPTNIQFKDGDTISVSNLAIYNSFFNIEAARGNNKFSIIWNANTSVQYDAIIPNSFLDVTALNYYIQDFCLKNDLYMNDLANPDKKIFYINIMTNPSTYSCSLDIFPLPTAAQATALGYTVPAGASWSLPVSAKTPQFITKGSFGNLLGFSAATFPLAIESTIQYFASTSVPKIALVNSILVGCNLINSAVSNNSNLFTSIPIKTQFGGLIDYIQSNPILSSITPSTYSKIVIEFYDQNYNPLKILDNEITLMLSIQFAPVIKK